MPGITQIRLKKKKKIKVDAKCRDSRIWHFRRQESHFPKSQNILKAQLDHPAYLNWKIILSCNEVIFLMHHELKL